MKKFLNLKNQLMNILKMFSRNNVFVVLIIMIKTLHNIIYFLMEYYAHPLLEKIMKEKENKVCNDCGKIDSEERDWSPNLGFH
jgi:hypothetical protein